MSTMLLDQDTFSNLARTLAGVDYTGNGQKYQMVGHNMVNRGDFAGFAGYQPNNKEYDGLNRLFGYLKVLNHRAYRNRYAHNEEAMKGLKYISYRKEPVFKMERYNIYQVLKSLECIRYNIDTECELLDRLIDLVKDSLIGELPDYKAADWG